MLSLSAPYPFFTDKDGDPLDGGYVYVGQVAQNPETAPVTVYWDEAGTQPAAQPLRTLAGYIVRNGTPARVYVAGDDFSMTVKNARGVVLYYERSVASVSSLRADLASSDPGEGTALVFDAARSSYFLDDSTAGRSTDMIRRRKVIPAAVSQTLTDVHGHMLTLHDFHTTVGEVLGTDDQTLYAVTPYYPQSVGDGAISQQTADAIAWNNAIRFFRLIGRGRLYIPQGDYRFYGYGERIDFPFELHGAGMDVTRLRNCNASPTNIGMYGILNVNPVTQSTVTIKDLTVDGNGAARAQPVGEQANYPLAIYGAVNINLISVKSVNSPIDCILTSYNNNDNCSLDAWNCILDGAYRNTLSCVSGWNQRWHGGSIRNGGSVQGGTAPGYTVDIEPNDENETIKNITFLDVKMAGAIGVVFGGTWAGNVKVIGGEINCTGGTSPQPWAANVRAGQFTFIGVNFKALVSRKHFFTCYGAGTGGEYQKTQFVKVKHCHFDGVGFQGYGPRMELDGNTFENSLYPVLFTGSGVQSLIVRNTTLINVIDGNNYGGGSYASFAILGDVEGYVDVDGLHVRIDPDALPAGDSFKVVGAPVTGIYIAPSVAANDAKFSNIHSAGYFRKYPNKYGLTLGSNYRDWGTPTAPPADTAGQTAGPGAPYWRNCTQYGDAA